MTAHPKLSLLLCSLFFVLSFGEFVVDTSYWDAAYPSVVATCENRNEGIMVNQIRKQSICYDGTDMPWTQVPIPKARLYYCTSEGELMYQECAPYQFTSTTACQVNCTAPVKSTVALECYHGTRLHTISCEAAAPKFTGSYLQGSAGFNTESYLYGPQTCEDAWGPSQTKYACNNTHYWTLNQCQTACLSCVVGQTYPLSQYSKCTNSKSLQCYEGYYQDSDASVPVVTKTVDSDVVCARFDYTCHLGDCSCTQVQQQQRACKRAYGFMSAYECNTLANSSAPSANVYCCSGNKCNKPKDVDACSAASPPQVKIYEDSAHRDYTATYTGSVVSSLSKYYSGRSSLLFSSLASNPSATFACRGCVDTALGFTSVKFYYYVSGARDPAPTITSYLLQKTTRIFVQANTISVGFYNIWGAVQFDLPQGDWDGVSIVVSGTTPTVYIDLLTLN